MVDFEKFIISGLSRYLMFVDLIWELDLGDRITLMFVDIVWCLGLGDRMILKFDLMVEWRD